MFEHFPLGLVIPGLFSFAFIFKPFLKNIFQKRLDFS